MFVLSVNTKKEYDKMNPAIQVVCYVLLWCDLWLVITYVKCYMGRKKLNERRKKLRKFLQEFKLRSK